MVGDGRGRLGTAGDRRGPAGTGVTGGDRRGPAGPGREGYNHQTQMRRFEC